MTTRGSLFWTNLGSTPPPEFGKTRPGLVLDAAMALHLGD